MKKIIFLFLIWLFSFSDLSAQSFHFGLKAGGDLLKINGQSFKEEFKFGYHEGAFAEIGLPFTKIGLQPEVYFSQVNKRVYTGIGISGLEDITLSYINIPVLLNFKVAPMLSLQAGPQFGIMINKEESVTQTGKDALKDGDVGIAAGLQFNLKKIKLYGRYFAGLNDINNHISSGDWHNRVIHLGIGFRLF